jgi:hypothetical protein
MVPITINEIKPDKLIKRMAKAIKSLKPGKRRGQTLVFRSLPCLTPNHLAGLTGWCICEWYPNAHTVDFHGVPLGEKLFEAYKK